MDSVDDRIAQARRYLLGQSSEDECALIEREYFADDAALELMAGAEGDLIDDYLADRLARDDRDRFERVYLATPDHRRRVEVTRRMRSMVPAPASISAATEEIRKRSSSAWTPRFRWALAAAAALVVVAAGLWFAGPAGRQTVGPTVGQTVGPTVGGNAGPTVGGNVGPTFRSGGQGPGRGSTGPAPTQSRVFAVSLSPLAIRGPANAPAVVIPAGTDTVRLRLEGDRDPRFRIARAAVQIVGGGDVWEGPVAAPPDLPEAIGEIDVPASRLSADDFVITVFGIDQSGAETERDRYFMRVR